MTRSTRIAAAVFAAGLVLIPAAATLAAAGIEAGLVSDAVRIPFRLLCHGLETRAFTFNGTPLPICARCTGVYLGGVLGIALFVLLRPMQRRQLAGVVAAIFVLPLAVDGTLNALALLQTANAARALTGVLAGAPLLIWILGKIESGTTVKGGMALPPRAV